MFKYLNKKATIIGIAALTLLFVFIEHNKSQDIVVAPLKLDDGLTVQFPYTDDNTGESLIIKTDQQTYSGLSGSDVYISITNTRNVDEKAVLLFHMPKSPDILGAKLLEKDIPSVATLAQYETDGQKWNFIKFFKDDIKINQNLLGNALKKRESIPKELAINAGAEIQIPANKTIYFKSSIKYPPGSKGEFWIETIGTNGGYGLLDPWYSSTFLYRKKLTIPYAKVSGGSNLSNFPVLISHIDPDIRTTTFGGKAASGSGEFIFTSSDGTTSIPYEIESYSATTGQFIGWVNVTTLSATQDTSIYMYYGGAAAGGATNQNKTGTWDSNYKGVWHLQDNAANKTVIDSTGTNNGTNQANTNTKTTAGKVSGALNYVNGSADYTTIANESNFDITNNITVEAWIKATSLPSGWRGIVTKGDSAWRLARYSGTNNIAWSTTGPTNADQQGTFDITDGAWHHIVATYDGSNKKQYYNGAIDVTTVATGALSTNNIAVAIGENLEAAGRYWGGTLDEVRVSDTIRAVGWIATEYNNQKSPRTFYVLGGQEAANRTSAGTQFGTTISADTKPGWYQTGGTWSNRKKITIPYTKVSGGANLSNFPVLISHTDPDIRTTTFGGKAASGSGEFIFTSSDGTTSLPYEIESYSATTGQFIGWVNVTTLSATQDTSIYMYYGGASAGGATNQNKTGTWDTNYKGVWHFPNGTTLTANDSTGVNNGILSGATIPNAIAGQVDGGGNFDGSSGYVDAGSATSLDITTVTLSFWFKADTIGATVRTMVAKNQSGTNEGDGWVQLETNSKVGFGVESPNTSIYSDSTVSTGVWYAVTTLCGTGGEKLYLNGVQQADTNADTSCFTNTTPNFIMGANRSNSQFFDGTLDEVRISNVVRSAGWIATEYNNQFSPRTFYMLGGQEGRTSANPNIQIKGGVQIK